MSAGWWLPLTLRSLRSRWFACALTVLTITLGVVLLVGVDHVRTQARESFTRTVSGTDLIVGARTSPVGLLLYSVFHLGEPTSNISWHSAQRIAGMPEVAWTVPISLGDSHRGRRVIGTSSAFLTRYRYAGGRSLALAQGRAFGTLHEAVIGAEVARAFGYDVGARIVLAHGTSQRTLHAHDDAPFEVVGVLAPTGTPVDTSILTSLQSIEAIHLDWHSGVRLPGSGEALESSDLVPDSITAMLVGLERRGASFAVQRRINDDNTEPLLAILPGVALQQLWRLLGTVERAFALVSAAVVCVGLIGMTTALVGSLGARRREMAILRALGASPAKVAALLLVESLLLTLSGIALGLVALQAALVFGRAWLLSRYGLVLEPGWPGAGVWPPLAGVAGAGVLAGLVPTLIAYRTTLADGLSPRI